MLFAGPSLRVILATIHVPLMAVGAALSTRLVLDTIVLAARACEQLGVAKPRIAVCGLNPHAGEGGLLGAEDRAIISPAIASAIAKGLDATGPHPADTIFHKALMTDGRRRDATNGYDCVVAMYHDQGLIPVKLADPRSTVNVTVGLEWQGRPVIRTSPAHGTAFDIAGRNLADPASMLSAIELALEMIDQRCAREATRDGRATTGGALHS
jgi:4-hydroxythreonine-4-phosphate dehydrogenase